MSYGILVQGFKIPNLVEEYKTIFLGNRGKPWNSPKTFSLYLSFLKNRIFWAAQYWFKTLKCQIWLTNKKPFFWENEGNLETLQQVSLYIWVYYKFVLKSFNSLNWILWAMEYWFKALKCQIWCTNTESFFWESETNIETLQKGSPYTWVFYKFILKSGKNLSWLWLLLFRIFWMLNIQLSNTQLETI